MNPLYCRTCLTRLVGKSSFSEDSYCQHCAKVVAPDDAIDKGWMLFLKEAREMVVTSCCARRGRMG
jgi:hypothetical protein